MANYPKRNTEPQPSSLQQWFEKRGIGPMGAFHISAWVLIIAFFVLLRILGEVNIFDFQWNLLYDDLKPGFQAKKVATIIILLAALGFYISKVVKVFKNKA